MSLQSRLRRSKSPAMILAGLLFFAPCLGAETPPARSVAAPVVEDHAKDITALKAQIEKAEQVLERLKAAQETSAKSQALQQSSIESLVAALGGLEKDIQDLKGSSAKSQALGFGQTERLDGLAKDLESLRSTLSSEREKIEAGLKDMAATRSGMEERSTKLASLSELLGVIKKDVDNNNEELVELRQSLKKADIASVPADQGWWGQVLGWKPLPVVAGVLGVVALGVAAFKP